METSPASDLTNDFADHHQDTNLPDKSPPVGYWNHPATITTNNFIYKSLSNFALNIAVGCLHGCRFCFVPSVATNKQKTPLADKDVANPDAEWGDYAFVRQWDEKAFLASLRKAEAIPISDLPPDGHRAVFLCSTTDAYQVFRHPDRGRQRDLQAQSRQIVRRSLELIRDHSTLNVRILTRSPLVRRDFNLLQTLGNRVLLGMSIPTLDSRLLRVYEPKAPAPAQRIAALQAAKEADIPIYVALAPTFPECDEADLRRTLCAVAELKPHTIFHEPVNIRAENVARIRKHAQALGVELRTDVFETTASWAKYALEALSTVERIAAEIGVTPCLHLWPDKALGREATIRALGPGFDASTHKHWLEHWWTRISEWPSSEKNAGGDVFLKKSIPLEYKTRENELCGQTEISEPAAVAMTMTTPVPSSDFEILRENILAQDLAALAQLTEEDALLWRIVSVNDRHRFHNAYLKALRSRAESLFEERNAELTARGRKKFGGRGEIAAALQDAAIRREAFLAALPGLAVVATATAITVPIDLLTEHPRNDGIYRRDAVADQVLADDIEVRGLLTPLVVTQDFVVLSGHRRLRAWRQLGRTEIATIICRVDEQAQLAALLEFNRQRDKNSIEKIREFDIELLHEQQRAKERRAKGKKLPENLPDGEATGEARKIAAKKIGLSARTLEKGSKVLRAIDERRDTYPPQMIAEIENLLERRIDAAFKLAIEWGWLPAAQSASGGGSGSTRRELPPEWLVKIAAMEAQLETPQARKAFKQQKPALLSLLRTTADDPQLVSFQELVETNASLLRVFMEPHSEEGL